MVPKDEKVAWTYSGMSLVRVHTTAPTINEKDILYQIQEHLFLKISGQGKKIV